MGSEGVLPGVAVGGIANLQSHVMPVMEGVEVRHPGSCSPMFSAGTGHRVLCKWERRTYVTCRCIVQD